MDTMTVWLNLEWIQLCCRQSPLPRLSFKGGK